MNIPFDYFNNPEKPDLSLCYLDDTSISPIFDPEGLELSFEFLNPHEVSFRVYENYQQDGIQKTWAFYKEVNPYKQVLVENLGYYVITDVSEVKEASNPYKDITATSCEITLGYKDVNLSEGAYLFVNPKNWNDPKTIVGMISAKAPKWKIVHIDESLNAITRFLDGTDGNLYDFLKNTVEDRYGCIFQFDILHHTISILDQNRDIAQADIFLSHDNFIENISIDYNNDEIFTALRAIGGDDISIESVNPIGGSIIYQFDYFQHDMPDGLWDAVVAWRQKIADNQKPFSQAILKVQELNGEILKLEQDKIALESQKTTYEQIIALRKESDLAYADVEQSLQDVLEKITALTSQIQAKQREMETYKTQYENIQSDLAFSNNFTAEQILQLDPFIIYGEFRDDNIITTSNMSYEEKQKQSQELYDRCVQALADTLINKGSFDVDSQNFLFDSKFRPYAEKLELGTKIYVEANAGDYTPYLLIGFNYSYDNDSLSLSFNNLGVSPNSLDTYAKLYGELNKATSVIQNTLSSKVNTTTIDQLYDDLQDIKGQAEAILTAGELTVKKIQTEYISVENAETPGKTTINGGNITTGILRSDDGTTFFLDLDKGILKMEATSLQITGKTVDQIAQEKADAAQAAAAQDLQKFANKVSSDVENLQGQIDGQVQTWFYNYVPTSTNAPANGWTTTAEKNNHLGDLFYIVNNSTAGGRAYRWALVDGVYQWILIEDEDVAKALANAAKAQDTADGKRRVFVSQPKPPYDVGDLWTEGPSGNLLRCKTDRQTGSYVKSDWELATDYIDRTTASGLAQDAVNAQTQEDIFNRLTNNGQLQGLFMKNGNLYMNATYLKAGTLDAQLVEIVNLIADHVVSTSGGFKLDVWAAISSLTNQNKLRLRHYCTDNDLGLYQCFSGNVDSKGTLLDSTARYSFLTPESIGVGQDKNGNYQGNVYTKKIYFGQADIETSTGGNIEFYVQSSSYMNSFQMFEEGSGEKRTVFRCDINGTAYLGTTGYRWNTGFFTNTITQSDLKDKENIEEIPNAKEFVMALKPICYTLKDGDGKRTHMGFGAQDVAKTASQFQMGNLALYQASVMEDDGSESYYREGVPDEKLAWGLNYHEFLAPIVATIQEQQKEIEQLRQEIQNIKEGIS